MGQGISENSAPNVGAGVLEALGGIVPVGRKVLRESFAQNAVQREENNFE